MRCKKHLSDHSSSVGVCSSCLRERLVALIAQQTHLNQRHTRVTSEDPRQQQQQQQQQPPPLLFPRSVSPYVSRRKSDDTTPSSIWAYSTPQVGPTYNGKSTFTTTGGNLDVKRRSGKFSLLSSLFRSRSDKYNSDPRVASRDTTEPSSSFSSSPSSWFFSTIFPSRWKNKSSVCYADDTTTNSRIGCRLSNRGMSPARETESDEDCDRSSWTDEWRRTPMAAVPAVKRTRTATHGKNVSGLAFCLSPLVRASPSRHWNQKGGLPGESVYSSEIRSSTVKPHLSTAASFCANRSRKLADFGRVNHNR